MKCIDICRYVFYGRLLYTREVELMETIVEELKLNSLPKYCVVSTRLGVRSPSSVGFL